MLIKNVKLKIDLSCKCVCDDCTQLSEGKASDKNEAADRPQLQLED